MANEQIKKLPDMPNYRRVITLTVIFTLVAVLLDVALQMLGHEDGLPEPAWYAIGIVNNMFSSQCDKILNFYLGENSV